MTTLLLVRHSQTRQSAAVPARDWPLTAEGRRRCMLLAAALAPWRPDRIVSSVEPKARETARITGALLDRPVQAIDGLQEHDRRGMGFLPAASFLNGVAALLTQPERPVFGRETGHAAAERFAAALSTCLTTRDTVAVITHGSVLSLFLAARGLVDPLPFWITLGQPALVVADWPLTSIRHQQLQLDTVGFAADQRRRGAARR